MTTIIQHYVKDGVWYEASYVSEPRFDREHDEVVYRKIPKSEKKCECIKRADA